MEISAKVVWTIGARSIAPPVCGEIHAERCSASRTFGLLQRFLVAVVAGPTSRSGLLMRARIYTIVLFQSGGFATNFPLPMKIDRASIASVMNVPRHLWLTEPCRLFTNPEFTMKKLLIKTLVAAMLLLAWGAPAALTSPLVTTPTNGQVYLTNEAYLVTATASGAGVSNVLFMVDGAQVGSDDTAPYTFNASALALGSHTIYAVATNTLTAEVGYSLTNTFTVTNAQASLYFNGSSYVTMGNVAGKGDFNSLSNFTVEFWFVRTGAGTADGGGAGTAGLGSTAIHGGGAAVPLVCRGDSEGEGSAIDANFYIGIVTNNGVAVLGADIEAYAAGTNGLIP